MLATKRGACIGIIACVLGFFIDWFGSPIISSPLLFVLITFLQYSLYGVIVDVLLKMSRNPLIDYIAGFIASAPVFFISATFWNYDYFGEEARYHWIAPAIPFFIVWYLSKWTRKKLVS